MTASKTDWPWYAPPGYGIVPPTLEDMRLEEPKLIRHGSRFGVQLKATAAAIHMIRVDVESEFSPIIGTESRARNCSVF